MELRVLTTDTAGSGRKQRMTMKSFPTYFEGGYPVYFCRKLFGRDFSPSLLFRLWPMIRWADVVHLTAVYSTPTIPAQLICRLLGRPIVWSPRGALQRWEQTPKLALKLVWERICRALMPRDRSFLHVTSDQESAETRKRIPGVTIAVIPNGVVVPSLPSSRLWQPGGILRLMFLGRLHPIKGIENLLLAIRATRRRDLTLAIYGAGEPRYVSELQEYAKSLETQSLVRFAGWIDGTDKINAFLNADVCVVPSFSENFGMVVAEALAHGVPVIAGRGTPWDALEKKECGFWVANDPDSLAEAITRIRGQNLPEMGARGREWMREHFGWNSIGQQMLRLYDVATSTSRDT